MRLQRDQPFDDTRPLTRADARAAGLPVSELLTRRYRRLFHDVHVRAGARTDVAIRAGAAIGLNARGTVDGVDLVDLVVAADSLLRAGALELDELHAAAARWTGRGSRVGRRAVALARDGVDSAMESRLRLLIVLAGLPEPEVDHQLRDEIGTTVLRFDLSYPALKLLIEYDGRQHAENEKQWTRDVRRRETLDGLGLRLLVVLEEGIDERPLETLDRIAGALRERGVRVRRSYKPEWERYFPGRTGPAVHRRGPAPV